MEGFSPISIRAYPEVDSESADRHVVPERAGSIVRAQSPVLCPIYGRHSDPESNPLAKPEGGEITQPVPG